MQRVVFNASGAVPPPGAEGNAREAVDTLAELGLSATVLQPTLYLENLLLPFILSELREGVFRYPLAASGFGVKWVATQDLGALATRALETTDAGLIAAAGPEALDGDGLAQAIGRGVGRTIRFETVAPADFETKLKPLLGPESAAAVRGLYQGIAAAPESFAPWLAPDPSPGAAALGIEATTVESWAASVLRPLLDGPAATESPS